MQDVRVSPSRMVCMINDTYSETYSFVGNKETS